jgi:hypothetical protein
MWNKVNGLEYEAPLDEATIVKDYDEAERLLGEIQENVENINFSNNNIIADILDKEHSFDKVSYSKELKISINLSRFILFKFSIIVLR